MSRALPGGHPRVSADACLVDRQMLVDLDAVLARVAVAAVNVNGHEYRNTVGVMGGKYLVNVSSAVRKVTGLNVGDPIDVTLTLAEGPRPVDMPDDFKAALDREPDAAGFFAGLSSSLQRYHVDLVNGAKTRGTRDRRIAKAVDRFLAGEKR